MSNSKPDPDLVERLKMPVVNPKTRRLAAYLLLALAGLFGFIRVESRANDAKDAAAESRSTANDAKNIFDQFKAETEKAKADTDAKLIDQCVTANEGRLSIRQTFLDIIAIASALPPPPNQTPEEAARRKEQTATFLAQFTVALEQRLPLKDCNKDGAVNESDGVPTPDQG